MTQDNAIKQEKKSKIIFFIIFLIISLSFVTSIAAFLYVKSEKSSLYDLNKYYEEVSAKQIEKLTENYNSLNKNFMSEKQVVNELFSEIDSRIKSINISSKENVNSYKNKNIWKLFEIKFLLKIANRKYVIDSDYKTSLSILKEVDYLAASIDDERLLQFRKVIANDISYIKGIKIIDKSGISLKIHTLINETEKLPFLKNAINDTFNNKENISYNYDDWQENTIASLKNFLSNFFVIQKKNNDFVLLTDNEERELKLNIETSLNVATYALINNDIELAKKKLSYVKDVVQKYMDKNDFSVNNFLTEINELLISCDKNSQSVHKDYLESSVAINSLIDEFDVEE